MSEFSFRTREASLRRFREDTFDLLVVGGGITGAATARDAASRGLKVALVERNDFASGTSSRSSKLIHGGLRYLQNLEFHLVFEALSERAFLLKSVPHMVRPMPFFLPVYDGDPHGRALMGFGLWLYDLLALFRTPGFHKGLSRARMLEQIPFLKDEGLKGGFSYFDASMWDDVLAVETLRAAHQSGAAVANYVEAVAPQWTGDRISGFRVRDREQPPGKGEIDLKAHRTVICAGPWTDKLGQTLTPNWRRWLNPSKGVHLLFDLKRIPVPGALVMGHPEDGRIAFVIPRPDYGTGVVIVGTTDGPTPPEPEKAEIEAADVRYLLSLLQRYFPKLGITASDILSAYVGVRPLMGATASTAGSEGQMSDHPTADTLQKVSREHFIGLGPGGAVLVAGGKYTTHRTMATEIVDFTIQSWKQDVRAGKGAPVPSYLGRSRTGSPVNPQATAEAVEASRAQAAAKGVKIPEELLSRFGAEALDILESEVATRQQRAGESPSRDPEAFPMLESQLRHLIKTSMVMHLDDFICRRTALFAARADHGLPWAERLARIWAEERGLGEADARSELELYRAEVARRSAWRKSVDGASRAEPDGAGAGD
jgi:glycerol-3-phosphate dehydrogenase